MKLNPIQVAASATGAVASAVIASFFGVRGTIIGVAVGSIVATTATALVGQWIERTHQAVRQVVVKNADQVPFLRRSPETGAAGEVTSTQSEPPASEPVVPDEGGPRTDAVGTTRLVGSSRGGPPAPGPAAARVSPGTADRRRRPGWRPVALSLGLVFVVALAVVTALELAAGRPLSSLVGGSQAPAGTSAGNLFSSTPPSTTTTTTAPSSDETTTTVPPSPASTTTSTSTTTTTVGSGTTTTTVPSANQGSGPAG